MENLVWKQINIEPLSLNLTQKLLWGCYIVLLGCASTSNNLGEEIAARNYLQIAQQSISEKSWTVSEEYVEHSLASQESGEAYITLAWLKLRQCQWKDSLAYARKARTLNPTLVKPYFFEAADCLLQQDYLGAWKWCETVRILFPEHVWDYDELLGLQTALWRQLLFLERQNLPHTGLQIVDKALQYFPSHAIYLTFRAKFLISLGKYQEAEVVLRETLEKNPYELSAVQEYRRILFQQGKYQEGLKTWQRIVPEDILLDIHNKVRHLYIALEQAANMASVDDPQTLEQLADCLVKFGWEKEALFVYDRLPKTGEKYIALKNHLSFLESLNILLEQNYEYRQLSMIRLLDQIQDLAKKHDIPLMITPRHEVDTYFLVVREVDPFVIRRGTLAEYLAKYNKVIDLGNNYGYLDCRLMNRISWTIHQKEVLGRKMEYHVIIGDETQIDNYIGYYSGSPKVAGRTFFSQKGFYIALDTIRPSLGSLKNTWNSIIQIPDTFPVAHPTSEYNRHLSAKFLEISLTKDFLAKYTKDSPTDNVFWDDLYQCIIHRHMIVVHYHELGHIYDFWKFLPIHYHWDNLVKMLWKQGLSPENIQGRFESVAEIFGLTQSPDPHYYIFQIMERLDVNYSGIFELVYWAWYGKMPQQDPYYRASIAILRDIDGIANEETITPWNEIASLAFHPTLHKVLQKLAIQVDTK